MTYIRIKRIRKKSGNEYEYAYLVENKWRKRVKNGKPGARQKVKEFLGRISKPELVNDVEFLNYLKIADFNEYSKNSYRKIVMDLIEWELYKHDVREINFDQEDNTVRKNDKKIVVQMNEGFLCDHTLRKLIIFKFKEDEYEAGMALAKVFVDAGMDIPKELFVKVYEKMN
ncbi:MAG: hypothetical protein ABIC04_02175 [Nanoarchaeota archaeon]